MFATPPVIDRPGSALARSGKVVQAAALALLTLVLTLAGQASIARGALQMSAPLDGVVDRVVAGDRGILPAKPGLRTLGEAQGPRGTADRDPPVFIIAEPAPLPAPPPLADPERVADGALAPQTAGWAHRARGPPMARGAPSLTPRLPSWQATPSRLMA